MEMDDSDGGWRSALLDGGLLAGGNLRAAVLGANDGLVSNLSLVMGVAGGASDPTIVLLAGIAGLLAGAFSMAAGEWISVSSQADVYRHLIRRAFAVFHESPVRQERTLADIYHSKGLTEAEAGVVARRIMANPDVALDTMAREGLGLDPSSLGSPFGAAASSFVAFSLGAVIPIVPYLLDFGSMTLTLSALCSAVALVVVGALVAAGSGRSVLWGGTRMLLAGGVAAAVTFGIGSLIGVALVG